MIVMVFSCIERGVKRDMYITISIARGERRDILQPAFSSQAVMADGWEMICKHFGGADASSN